MSGRCIAGVVVALTVAAAPAFAQTLADVARAEEARRASAPKAKKALSNVDLGPGAVQQVAAVLAAAADESCYMSVKLGRCVTAEEMVANSAAVVKVVEDPPKEESIRSEANTVRDELNRLQTDIAALEGQESDTSLARAKRQAATDALATRRLSLEGFQRRWARLERQVKELKLPHAWIEPVPENARPQ